jgi:hypothetical protein
MPFAIAFTCIDVGCAAHQHHCSDQTQNHCDFGMVRIDFEDFLSTN